MLIVFIWRLKILSKYFGPIEDFVSVVSLPIQERLLLTFESQERLLFANCLDYFFFRRPDLSPFKVVRELGLERRETVRSLSAVGVGKLRGAVPSTRGPEWTYLWCTGCNANCIAG